LSDSAACREILTGMCSAPVLEESLVLVLVNRSVEIPKPKHVCKMVACSSYVLQQMLHTVLQVIAAQ
jgi:hypothetical protein